MNSLASSFAARLQKLNDPHRAENEKKYHKSQRIHWGVSAGGMDQTIRETIPQLSLEEMFSLSQSLWESSIFDLMVCSARILSHKKIQGSRKLWREVKRSMRDVDGWCLEDNLAKAAWKCIAEDESILDDLEQWTHHKNFWYRRAALIFTLPYAKQGKDPERMLKWAGKYAADKEWFIQKAIGWWLRDLGAHNPERVIQFLNEYWPKLQYVAKKESTRKLEKKYLKKIHHFSLGKLFPSKQNGSKSIQGPASSRIGF
ncbi:MAG: DNA alkylation repair protein [Candidatus Altimarinota bacterium]